MLILNFIILVYLILTKNKRFSLPLALKKFHKKLKISEDNFWPTGLLISCMIFIPFTALILVGVVNADEEDDDNENDFSFN